MEAYLEFYRLIIQTLALVPLLKHSYTNFKLLTT